MRAIDAIELVELNAGDTEGWLMAVQHERRVWSTLLYFHEDNSSRYDGMTTTVGCGCGFMTMTAHHRCSSCCPTDASCRICANRPRRVCHKTGNLLCAPLCVTTPVLFCLPCWIVSRMVGCCVIPCVVDFSYESDAL